RAVGKIRQAVNIRDCPEDAEDMGMTDRSVVRGLLPGGDSVVIDGVSPAGLGIHGAKNYWSRALPANGALHEKAGRRVTSVRITDHSAEGVHLIGRQAGRVGQTIQRDDRAVEPAHVTEPA